MRRKSALKKPRKSPLRAKAEARLAGAPRRAGPARTAEELHYELLVHQIELEMQNEELRRAGIALEESRDRYVDLYEFAPIGYLLLTAEGLISEINLAGATLLGEERKKLIQRRFARFVVPEASDGYHRVFTSVMQHDTKQDCELKLRRSDGSVLHAHLDCLRVAAPEGPPIVRIALTDITERRRSEELFRASVESAPLAMLMINREGTIILANAEAVRLFGYGHKELLGHQVEMLVPDRLKPGYSELRAGFLLHPEARRMGVGHDLYAVRKDGTEFPVEIGLNPIETEHGTFILSAIVDVTDRKRAEAALQESEARKTAIVQSALDCIVTINHEGKILEFNPAAERVFGYASAEVVGRALAEVIIPPSLREAHRQGLTRYLATGETHILGKRIEMNAMRSDGTEFPVELSVTPLGSGVAPIFTGFIRDITQRKAAEADIERLAYFDPLTQLPNRRLLLDRLQHAVAARARNRNLGAILFVDLDDFKNLNDTEGHDVGDLLLQRVAGRLRVCVRAGDTIARQGGDEFVVMLENLSENPQEAAFQAKAIGEKILGAIAQHCLVAGREYHCTASVGVALFGDHRESVDDLLKRADLAMYRAKASGSNRVQFFDSKMQAGVARHASMAADLRRAVQEGEFVLLYQPQVDDEGRLTGAEALIRWDHSRRGLVSPAEFIPLAEETGLIQPLGEWVLETVCAQLVTWSARPDTAHLTLAVNVSAHEFRHPDFVARVLEVVHRARADPHKLVLEFTESQLVANIEESIDKMTALKGSGAALCLDDFCTGYSSLSYLKQLPLSQLKIDQSFVRNILTDPNGASIARTIVGLGQSLGLAVIAEGVETEEHRAFLARQGCHAFQGYLFGRPGSVEALPVTH